ncbi:TPA: ORF6N domain-containing protein, partial [Yersinia enterocolitica]|nr:ORF6N domain-containing protein [Yersinia enterocolitica]
MNSIDTLKPILHNQLPVITTDLLAQVYGTESVRIRQNYHENKERFIEGKHFFKVIGDELKDLRVALNYSQNPISSKVRSLILWTARGAARHAKMLETEQAWDVFEKLEDCYFNRIEQPPNGTPYQSTPEQLKPLHQTAKRLITTGLAKIYSDIWKLVHARFDVEHIHQLHPQQI